MHIEYPKLVLVVLASLFLAGCGQGGPLYLPPDNPDPPPHAQVAP